MRDSAYLVALALELQSLFRDAAQFGDARLGEESDAKSVFLRVRFTVF